MAAGDERHGIFVCARRGDRSPMEHDCDRRLGRYEIARGKISADWKFQCADAVRIARGDRVCESNWNGAHREAPPADGGLRIGGNGETRSDFVDIAECRFALRNYDRECSASETDGTGKLAVEREEDSHSRWRAIETANFDAVLYPAQGCGSVSCSVRRIPEKQKRVTEVEKPYLVVRRASQTFVAESRVYRKRPIRWSAKT